MRHKRIGWIDITKGIAILMVVYGHCMRDEMRLVNPALDFSYRCVYIFHMAFFFWLSGYSYQMGKNVYHKTYDRTFLIKKIKKQLVPWIVYSAFIYISFIIATHINKIQIALLNSGYTPISILQYICDSLLAENHWAYHLWFIYILFIISVFIFLVDHYFTLRKSIIVSIIFLCMVGLSMLHLFNFGSIEHLLNYLFLYIPFYLLGIAMQNYEPRLSKYSTVWGLIGVAYILARAKFWSGFSGNSVITSSVVMNMIVWYSAYIFLPGTFLLFKKVGIYLDKLKSKIIDLLKQAGKHSFAIYLFHQPVCCAFIGSLLYNSLGLPAPIVMIICFCTSLLVPAGILYLYNYIKRSVQLNEGK